MLNLIPALLIFLSSAPFGQSSGKAFAVEMAFRQVSVAVRLVDELQKAGLSAAQAVLVVSQYEDKAEPETSIVQVQKDPIPATSEELMSGFWENCRSRDGPRSN